MKTEELNDYIFGKMVADIAQTIRHERLDLLRSSGTSEDEISKSPVTEVDMRQALARLDLYRIVSLEALQESLSEPPK